MKVRLIAHASNHGGQVAQSVEQRTENPCVECSIHSLPTKRTRISKEIPGLGENSDSNSSPVVTSVRVRLIVTSLIMNLNSDLIRVAHNKISLTAYALDAILHLLERGVERDGDGDHRDRSVHRLVSFAG